MTIEQILAKVKEQGRLHVTVTGGEPLAQKRCLDLLTALCDAGYGVSLETSGAFPIQDVDARVSRVIDLKAPGSKQCDKNLYENIDHLTIEDQIKFVISDRADFEWAQETIEKYGINTKCQILFSPVIHGKLCLKKNLKLARDLAEWFLESNCMGRYQVQLHKLLWGDEAGH